MGTTRFVLKTKNMEQIKRNVISLSPRNFGENISEVLLMKLFNFNKEGGSHDLNDNNIRIESKFSRALDKINASMTTIDRILSDKDRGFVESTKDFHCNIQQVKPNYFDELYYGIFFNDKILIFKLTPKQLLSDSKLNYCDKQHRGNTGEGQFHIKQNNLQHHIDNYLIKELNWNQFVDTIKSSSEINNK